MIDGLLFEVRWSPEIVEAMTADRCLMYAARYNAWVRARKKQ